VTFDTVEDAVRFVEITCARGMGDAHEIATMRPDFLVGQRELIEAARDRWTDALQRLDKYEEAMSAQDAMRGVA
jgi:hypothetical protein